MVAPCALLALLCENLKLDADKVGGSLRFVPENLVQLLPEDVSWS